MHDKYFRQDQPVRRAYTRNHTVRTSVSVRSTFWSGPDAVVDRLKYVRSVKHAYPIILCIGLYHWTISKQWVMVQRICRDPVECMGTNLWATARTRSTVGLSNQAKVSSTVAGCWMVWHKFCIDTIASNARREDYKLRAQVILMNVTQWPRRRSASTGCCDTLNLSTSYVTVWVHS